MDEAPRLYPLLTQEAFDSLTTEGRAQYLREAIAALKKAEEDVRLALEKKMESDPSTGDK